MSFVHVLDDNTINKIAAGEVVERPASVIKELVENAIDAKADRIEVEIMAGGTSFMRVSDNGIGMSREDAEKAILRHATSKIVQVDDLQAIATLGFRGEALPSIASVSRFNLQTRQAGAELGTEIKITGGKTTEIGVAGCNLGTTIRVEDLFFNTPARKKFLKTNNTESGRINEFIIKLAISHPEIAFKLINNNKSSLATPGRGDLKETLQSLYGASVGQSLLPLEFEDEDIKLWGFVSKPSAIRSSRSWQTFIVNGRIIASRAIAKAIDNAYHALIPKSGYPLIALNIEVPQHTIDVNVHPQKTEMKFEDESRIFKAVYKAVLDAVRPKGQVGQLGQLAAQADHVQQHVEKGLQELNFGQPVMNFPLREEKPAMTWQEGTIALAQDKSVKSVQSVVDEEEKLPTAGMIPIGQVDDTYIIAQDGDSLYIVDQHAAHERVLFDRFSAQAEHIPSQQLLVHLILDFSTHESQIIEENLELLAGLGFGLEPSGPNQFRLMEVPADVPSSQAEEFIREVLASMEELHRPTAAELRQAVLATTACKAAIKAGFKLNYRQMEILLQELNDTAMPYTCPHGRPTIIKFSSDELAKMFKRTGF
ncbi:MAG: DNA mismatch repair endonuclease MutL [Veillonellaceae bacterium]|nr:DNA mismatch repair endonuclease MutL [Veillonellaceae bacterium]MDD6850143.1 DNA mismatch repair endonuclease MutL [Veillonellaceae bacterium]